MTQLDLILLLHVSRPQTHWSQCQTQYWSIIKKWCRCSTVVGVGLGWDGIWWVSLGRSIEHLTVCRLEGLVEDQDQHHGKEVDHWHRHWRRRCHGNPDGAWGSQKVTDYIWLCQPAWGLDFDLSSDQKVRLPFFVSMFETEKAHQQLIYLLKESSRIIWKIFKGLLCRPKVYKCIICLKLKSKTKPFPQSWRGTVKEKVKSWWNCFKKKLIRGAVEVLAITAVNGNCSEADAERNILRWA